MKPYFILAAILMTLSSFPSHACSQIVFRDATTTGGLREPLAGLMGHGAAVGDFDQDGHVDLFVGGFSDRPNEEYAPSAGPVANRLFRGRGDGTFEAIDNVPLKFARTSGAVFADFDNSGTLELYVANNTRERSRRETEPQKSAQLQRSQLLQYASGGNSGEWSDITANSNAAPDRLQSARNVGVMDYNRDGLLDILIVEDRFRQSTSSTRLLKNLGKLQFQDVTVDCGLPEDIHGLGLAIADLNRDGCPDFFVPHSNRMFISRGDGTYEASSTLNKVFAWEPLDGEDWPCGAAFADLNQDGRLDMVLSIHSVKARNRVYINDSESDDSVSFRDVTSEVGLSQVVPVRCPHVEVQDFNNDGLPDIYMSAAWLDDDHITPLIYVNLGVKNGLPKFAAPRDYDDSMVYFPAGPSADFDDDGRVDLFLVNWFAGNHSRLMMNETKSGHWLKVRVQGTKTNRMGIGSRVELYRPGKIGDQRSLLGAGEVTTGYGYASGQVAECHFGLGEQTEVDVLVTLPDGGKMVQEGVTCDQRVLMIEKE